MKLENYTIQTVSKITGLNPHTIRAWEKRYNAVVPERTDTGRRIYSQKDVDRLGWIKDLSSMGYALADLAGQKDIELDDLHGKYFSGEKQIAGQATAGPEVAIDPHTSLQHLLLALYDYRLEIISHEFQKLVAGLDQRQLCLDILAPLFVEISHQVDAGKINIAQEHALSAIIRFHVGASLYNTYGKNTSSRYKVVLAAPEGDLHEFGIILSGLLCSYYKAQFFFLGANLPFDSLKQALEAIDYNVVCLGASAHISETQPQFLSEYINKTHKILKPNQELWIGGPAKLNTLELNQLSNVRSIPTLTMLDNILKPT